MMIRETLSSIVISQKAFISQRPLDPHGGYIWVGTRRGKRYGILGRRRWRGGLVGHTSEHVTYTIAARSFRCISRVSEESTSST
jgi:hypothetical protein